MIKKIILSIVAVLTVLSPLVVFVPNASASSIYDETVHLVDNLKLGYVNPPSGCASTPGILREDQQFNWFSYLYDGNNWSNPTHYNAFKDNWDNVIDQPGVDSGWAVAQKVRDYNSAEMYDIHVWVATDPDDFSVRFVNGTAWNLLNQGFSNVKSAQIYSTKNVQRMVIRINGVSCDVLVSSFTVQNPSVTQTDANTLPHMGYWSLSYTRNPTRTSSVYAAKDYNFYSEYITDSVLFVATDNVSYPVGYEGLLIPDKVSPPDIDIYPKFSYSINQQGLITVHYLSSNLIDNSQSQDCSLPGPPGSWRLQVDFYKGASLEDTRTITCTEPIFDFETSGLGAYSIEMQYVNGPGDLPPPSLNNPKFPIEGYETLKSIINFNYNGFIMSGSNAQPQADCTVGAGVNSCDVQNEFNECDWADIGCHLSNFIIQLQIWVFNMLYAVFGITPNQVPQIEQVFSFELDTHGLTSVVTAPLSVFNNLISSNYTCSPLNLPLPNLDNKNIVLPCLTPIYQTYFSAGFIMYQTIITGIAFYYVTVNMLRHFKELTDPKKDSIEVTKL